MSKLKGIILYDIQLDGHLTGVYTNNHPLSNGTISTETARLVSSDGSFRGNGRMEYECFWFDHVEGSINGRLVFTVTNGTIEAEWFVGNDTLPTFTGYGFQMNERQIAISYNEA